jgi:1-phosphofructokinase family hexose kinase
VITVAALSPSLDITYLVDSLRLGAIHRPTETHRVAGGKPLNLARAAATLGATVDTVTVLGGPTGRFLEQELLAAGIAVRPVPSPAETRTCVSIASADRGDLTEVYPYAPAIPAEVWEQFRTVLAAGLDGRPGWLAVNGSAPQGLQADAFAELTGIAQAAGLRVAVDTHGPALRDALRARPELIKVNRYEAAELLDREAESADLAELTGLIAESTGGTVIITDGRAGAVSRGVDGGVHHVRLPADISGLYPVGSGDAFLGGWLAATDRGDAPEEALRIATGCGTANALCPGAGSFDRETAEDVARQAMISTIG